MTMISAVGLFCCDKFEETPNEKVSNMSKVSKSYFKYSTTIAENVEVKIYHLLFTLINYLSAVARSSSFALIQ